MPIQKVCVVCGKVFSVPPTREKTAKACSHKCAISVRAKSIERKITVVCEHCKLPFKIPRSHKNRRVYCSTDCMLVADRYRKLRSDRISGYGNPRWTGGEAKHKDGYVYKRAQQHPFRSNGYVLKHRLVMEEALKEKDPTHRFLVEINGEMYLNPALVVHHIDGDRRNNRVRNLLICTPQTHRRIHTNCTIEDGTYWPDNIHKSRLFKTKDKGNE